MECKAVCEYSHSDGSLETFEGTAEECDNWIKNHPNRDNPAYTLWNLRWPRLLMKNNESVCQLGIVFGVCTLNVPLVIFSYGFLQVARFNNAVKGR